MTSVQTRQEQLNKRLSELEGRLGKIEKHLEETPDANWSENAQANENDEVLEELGAAGLQEILAIRAALKRVENGSYGDCVTCGNKISEERLDLLPHTPFCKDHAVD